MILAMMKRRLTFEDPPEGDWQPRGLDVLEQIPGRAGPQSVEEIDVGT